jgi:predicted DNA-binding protein with PD1-like motif
MITIGLEAGDNLLEGVHRGVKARGFTGAVARLGHSALFPFAYVIPALSKTGETAAFYSDTFRPQGIVRLEAGAITVGWRDGAPFFHCHALWHQADGTRSAGHILPEETFVAEPAQIKALGIDGAQFEARTDAETGFKLFEPLFVERSGAETGVEVVALRLKPNQDILHAIESVSAAQGITQATIIGGVGSLIGAEFADGTVIENFATEAFIIRGGINAGADGKPRAEADAALVDYTGAIAAGSLVRGANPVLITFELALEVHSRKIAGAKPSSPSGPEPA